MESVFTGHDQVFLLLRPNCLTVCVLAAWQDGYEHFYLDYLAGNGVNNLKEITGEVNVHLVSGRMLHVSDDFDPAHVPAQQRFEERFLVSVRICLGILLVKGFHRHALAAQAFGVVGKQDFQFNLTR